MTRFKERVPEQTVEIIKRFFAALSDDMRLEESELLDGEIGVYSLSVQLYKGATLLLQTNGKGMQPAFARASAYAELYERFCNRHGTDGYLFDDTAKETAPSLQHLAEAFPAARGKEAAFLRYLQAECPAVRETAYRPLAPEDAPLYADPRHIFTFCGTNGMAAGNTLDEALVQGCSEVAERHVLCRCFFAKPLRLLEIPDSLLEQQAPESFEKIKAIRAAGFSLRFFDAAAATGLPVVISLWVSRAHGVHAVKFGAFPVFSVAVERCITETMQGRSLRDYAQFMPNAPYTPADRAAFYPMFKFGSGLLPEELFTEADILQTLPEDVYRPASVGNREMVSHFAALGRTGGFHLYYRDVSLTPEMAAVQVYSPELNAAFPADHLFMEDCPPAVARFLAQPRAASPADAAALLDLFERVPSLPDALCARLHLCGLESWAYIYAVAVLSFCAGETQTASDLLESISTASGFEFQPEIAALRCFLRYRMSETDDAALRKRMALWGYTDADLAAFFGDPAAFCNHCLSDVLFGELYRKNKALTAEMNRLFSWARKTNFI